MFKTLGQAETFMKTLIDRLTREEDGATAVEYGLIASLVVIAMIASMAAMSDTTIGIWNGVSTDIVAATGKAQPS